MTLNQEEKWLLEEKYGGTDSAAFVTDLNRLRTGEPSAYVIGHIPFLGCKIYLDSRPLIPRPETEYWVEKAIESIKAKEGVVQVLDLCAGSGCIGVAVAKDVPEAQVTFAEIDPVHLPTIKKNLEKNIISYSNHDIIQSDLFQNVSGTFDYILTNPPYIDPALDRAENSVKSHEPHLALYGGTKGLEIIDRIIKDASHHLNQGGQLWIEHEPEQSESIKKKAESSGFKVVTYDDQYGVDRYSVLDLL